jgi:hypothetical protein
MVASLLEHETVDREEVACIINNRPYPEPKPPVEGLPEIPKAAAAIEPEQREKPRRLPPNISPEPA